MARDRIKWIRGRKSGESPNYPYPNSYRSQQSREQKARALLDQWGFDVYHEPAKDPPAGESKQEVFYFKSDRGRESPLPQFRRCHIVTVDIPPPEDPENPGDPLDPEDGGMLEPPLPPVFPHPSPDEVPDLWGKSKVVFSIWQRWEFRFNTVNQSHVPDPDNITYGTGFPELIESADTTVNDWRMRIDPLIEDEPPYPNAVPTANLLNEAYTADDVTKMGEDISGGDYIGGVRNTFVFKYNIFSTADVEGLSINQLEAQRIPYWVGRHIWYGVYEQVSIVDDLGEVVAVERQQVESINVYTFRYAGDIRDVPPFLNLNAPDMVAYEYIGGAGSRDTPLEAAGLTAADVFDSDFGSDPPDIAEAVTPDDPGVDPVQPDEPYDPTSPSTPEDPDDPDYPDGDDFGDEPEDPLDPSPDEQPLKRYHCTCQDASRTETADLSSPWRSRWTDRSWTDSEAGADVHDGTAWCKHAIAVAMFMGEW